MCNLLFICHPSSSHQFSWPRINSSSFRIQVKTLLSPRKLASKLFPLLYPHSMYFIITHITLYCNHLSVVPISLWIPSEINSYLFSHSTRHGANYRSYLTPIKQMNVDFYLWKWLLPSTTTIFYIYLLTHPSASSSPTFLMTPKFSLKHNSDHVLLNLRNFLLLSALPHLPSCSSSS